MRLDKLTTKFQQALADAQSLAVGNDNSYIEPVHLLSALMTQEDGGTASLLARAGVNAGGATRRPMWQRRRVPRVRERHLSRY
jgi:ATP-dependent Clp protease ATP-binding subunit ClpB